MAEAEALVTNDAPAPPAEGSNAVAGQEGAQQQQPTRLESFFAITKSLIIRALVIYFISSFFRRPAPTPDPTATPGAPAPPRTSAWNYFENGAMFDMYVYVSEDYNFADFHRPE